MSASEHTFTCLSCLLAFKDPLVQRQHFKTDFHRYNLKRKECELPPVSHEKFLKMKQNAEEQMMDENHQQMSCSFCKKSFSTKSQYENHIASKKHKEKAIKLSEQQSTNGDDEDEDELQVNASKVPSASSAVKSNDCKKDEAEDDMEVDSDVETVDSDEWNENPVHSNNCIFCNHHSRTMTKNLKHMTEAHSFFIPYVEYCVDIKGLLTYLGEKVSSGYLCLWCEGNMFDTLEATRSHMLDKNHTKMLFEGEALAEYTDYYDFTTNHPDVQNPLEIMEIPDIDGNEHQLVLPSGSVIGHRSLMRYFKQSTDPSRAVVIRKKSQDKLRNILNMYRALGWKGTQIEAAKQKAMDIKYMQRVHQKYFTKLGVKANKLQTHFRAQIMQ
ncbi:zinc finger protein 622 [Copidosoma floridanum]|uniref:zinc finger protein 622 n=1 Tax=Copidosoma floridanum TaxID=29053 RepID=UPI0006C99CDC|nr:zinc finger protein 622 [Copidosoma floridanum]XP_014219826.1 zinc finger protein 622 [Copidosoma floridanum]